MITPIKVPINSGKSPASNKKTAEESIEQTPGIQLPQSVKPFDSMTMRSTIRESDIRSGVNT